LSQLTGSGWLAVAFLGLLCSGAAYIFWYDALAQIDASQVASFIYLEPLVTVAVAAVAIGETFTLSSFVGGMTILLGVYLVNHPAAPQKARVSVAGD
jgi:drug/metabolite transporter (DMT)-like permease